MLPFLHFIFELKLDLPSIFESPTLFLTASKSHNCLVVTAKMCHPGSR